ncbi:MAG TPA: FMN-binding negative transcriptional regulator [Casimicrobiaceae bacterium]|nr:FMN-binding negative transcriptional regulator [Casimicrobiaceae bacterium]
MSVYIPKHFAARDRKAAERIFRDHPFATLVTPSASEPFVTHLPLLHIANGEHGTLHGHFARANPHAGAAAGADSLAIFHGPHAYVTPSWYADPAGAVPTWNYAVVHAHGRIELARDSGETRNAVDMLVARFESERAQPWALGLTGARLDAMLNAIVGFRIRVTRVDVKLKLSQNRSREDRERVTVGLAGEGYADAEATAAWMRALAAEG